MKITCCIAAVLMAIAALAADAPKISASLNLTDGSTVKGALLTEAIKGSTAFGQKVEVPVALLRSLIPGSTNTPTKLAFTNGDTLSITPTDKHLTVDALVGKLSIPFVNIHRADFFAATPAATGPLPSGLVYWCTFDGPDSITRPAIGPAGVQHKGTFAPGHNGQALLLQRADYDAMTATLPVGVITDAGCIEFWAKVNDATGYYSIDSNPDFFKASIPWATLLVGIRSNDGMGNAGACSYCFNAAMGQYGHGFSGQASYAGLFADGQAQGWHHYALVWDRNGLPPSLTPQYGSVRCLLMIDGKVVSERPDNQDGMDFSLNGTEPYALTIYARNKINIAHPDSFLIDDFKIWNTPKTDFPR